MGTFIGLVHLVWALFVAMGIAADKIKFALGMHFLSVPFQVLPFSWKGALMLIVLSSISGYIVGVVFSFIWNKVAAKG